MAPIIILNAAGTAVTVAKVHVMRLITIHATNVMLMVTVKAAEPRLTVTVTVYGTLVLIRTKVVPACWNAKDLVMPL